MNDECNWKDLVKCRLCKEYLHKSQFHIRNKKAKKTECKKCESLRYSAYYRKNRKKILERQRQRYRKKPRVRENEKENRVKRLATVDGRATELLKNARTRARNKNLECTITKKWIIDRLNKGYCQETGMKFELKMLGGRNKLAPSIDRRNVKEGYTAVNCRVVIWAWNNARSTYGTRFLIEMVNNFLGNEDS